MRFLHNRESVALAVFHSLSNPFYITKRNKGIIMTNTNARAAKRIIHELPNILCHIQAHELPFVAKGLARTYNIPQKVMLKAMARYSRLYTN